MDSKNFHNYETFLRLCTSHFEEPRAAEAKEKKNRLFRAYFNHFFLWIIMNSEQMEGGARELIQATESGSSEVCNYVTVGILTLISLNFALLPGIDSLDS